MTGIVKSVDKSIQLSYKTFGYGDETIIAFHGFGHSKEELGWLIDMVPGTFRVVAIDVPGHGDSKIFAEKREKLKISTAEWSELIQVILDENHITSFHLIGYSLGGRMAMITAQLFTDKVKSLYLFSPDGIKKTITYRFANETYIGGWTLKKVLRHPHVAVRLLQTIGQLKLLPAPRIKFVRYQLEGPMRVSKVHAVWTSLSALWPSKELVFTPQWNRTIVVVFGERDPIIPAHFAKYLATHQHAKLHVLVAPLGHRTLKKEGIDFLKAQGLWFTNH